MDQKDLQKGRHLVPGGGPPSPFLSFFHPWAPLGAQVPPRPSPESPRDRFWSDFGDFWTPKCSFLVRLFMILGCFSGKHLFCISREPVQPTHRFIVLLLLGSLGRARWREGRRQVDIYLYMKLIGKCIGHMGQDIRKYGPG